MRRVLVAVVATVLAVGCRGLDSHTEAVNSCQYLAEMDGSLVTATSTYIARNMIYVQMETTTGPVVCHIENGQPVLD